MLATVVILTLGTAAALPFAVVSDPVVEGIFSVCNTLLNACTLYLLNKALTHSREAADEATTVRRIVDKRERNSHPPDDQWKREGDSQ